jgi:hypothetical protein
MYTHITHHVEARAGQCITTLHPQIDCHCTPTQTRNTTPTPHSSYTTYRRSKCRTSEAKQGHPAITTTHGHHTSSLSLAHGDVYQKAVQQGAVINIDIFDANCHPRAKCIDLTLLFPVLTP